MQSLYRFRNGDREKPTTAWLSNYISILKHVI
jgi:hypothetical protein